jgi:serine protease Do
MAWRLALMAAAFGAVSSAALGALPLYTEAPVPSAPLVREDGGRLPDLSHVALRAMPAVVGVLVSQAPAPQQGLDPAKDLFDHLHRDSPHKGLGTGFIIHQDGYILTNAHVVEDASSIEIDLGDSDEHYRAHVVGSDRGTDIALLKIDAARPLPVVPLGESDHLQVAEWVMVIGNPFGLSQSVTVGIVSHTGRNEIAPVGRDGYYDFIQTDASINPGNSGGPVVNLRGEVIGIATAINATGQGIGFAIPIDMAKAIVGQLKDHGKVIRSWMGVTVKEAPRDGKSAVVLEPRPTRGILVTDVIAGGPAAQGGIKAGDVITSFDGHPAANAARLRWYVSTAGVGKKVSLTVRREGTRQDQPIQVELGTAPAQQASVGTDGPAAPAEEPGSGAASPSQGGSLGSQN